MENTNIENLDSTTETPVEETETTETEETEATNQEAEETTEDVESLKEKNKQLYARAKKAEEEAKKLKATKSESKAEAPLKGELSQKDVIYLAKADIHEDDMDEVLDWAKFKKISLPEAHKQLRGVLREKEEQRKTAQATNTGAARRGTSKVSAETLLEKANRTGELPDNDDALASMVEARFSKKKA